MVHDLRLTSVPASHHAEKHCQYLRDPLAVVGEAVEHLVRKAEHPLAHGHPGQHLVDQARGRIGHAPAAAGRAEPSLLAGNGNDPARPAVLTTGLHEPVGQIAAFEVAPHLFLDMERHPVLGRSGMLEKGFQRPGEDPVWGLLSPAHWLHRSSPQIRRVLNRRPCPLPQAAAPSPNPPWQQPCYLGWASNPRPYPAQLSLAW